MIEPRLTSEIEIVHLIYTKYRAQQRTQKWWRFLAILHRRLLRMVQRNKVDPISAAFVIHKLTPKAARAFHSILAQGAFITLGFTLIAALARIRTLLEPYVDRLDLQLNNIKPPLKLQKPAKVSPAGIHAGVTDEDIGEALEVTTSSTPTPEAKGVAHKSSKHPQKHHKVKKKKKSGHSAIDDIFG